MDKSVIKRSHVEENICVEEGESFNCSLPRSVCDFYRAKCSLSEVDTEPWKDKYGCWILCRYLFLPSSPSNLMGFANVFFFNLVWRGIVWKKLSPSRLPSHAHQWLIISVFKMSRETILHFDVESGFLRLIKLWSKFLWGSLKECPYTRSNTCFWGERCVSMIVGCSPAYRNTLRFI